MPWARYSRYEIKDDVIRPSPGAKLRTYDPWRKYHATSRKRPRAEPPYQALIDLAEKLELELTNGIGRPPRVPTAESEKRILRWCNQYGLLGILPALTRTITLAPCWTPLPESATSKKSPTLVPAYQTYLRDGGGWRVITHFEDVREARILDEKAKQEGEPIPKALVPTEWPQPGAFQRDWRTYQWKRNNPLQGEFRKFFPMVPKNKSDSYQYPVPGTEEFWHVYAEPVEVFTNWALKFKSCAETVTRLDEGEGQRTKDENWNLMNVASFLNSLTSSVCPSADVERGGITQRWSSASLVGSLAFMFVLDQQAGKRSRACLNEKCRTWFVSGSPKALYCSPTCRRTVQMRRFRKKHPKGGKQHAKTRTK